jgi:hypothetical protein
MGANTGSFGLLKPHYAITAQGVTISRNIWVPLVMLALAAPGIWCLSEALGHAKANTGLFAAGFVGVMAAVFALVMTPWLTPGKIVVSREGVAWGGTKIARPQVAGVRASAAQVRSSRYGSYQAWSIVVALANGKPLILSLGGRNRWASAERLDGLVGAMNAALGPR